MEPRGAPTGPDGGAPAPDGAAAAASAMSMQGRRAGGGLYAGGGFGAQAAEVAVGSGHDLLRPALCDFLEAERNPWAPAPRPGA